MPAVAHLAILPAISIIQQYTPEVFRMNDPLQIVDYPHPTLRHRSKPLKRVDAALRALVDRMFELMHAAGGVGLAANQVDLPYRLLITSVPPTEDAPGEDRVFVNPVIAKRKGNEERSEGCLSFPELFAPVIRPAIIAVESYDLSGQPQDLLLDGLAARAVQHELDHLDGVLFIDRLSPTAKLDVKEELLAFESRFAQRRAAGEIPDDQQIAARLAELEKEYC